MSDLRISCYYKAPSFAGGLHEYMVTSAHLFKQIWWVWRDENTAYMPCSWFHPVLELYFHPGEAIGERDARRLLEKAFPDGWEPHELSALELPEWFMEKAPPAIPEYPIAPAGTEAGSIVFSQAKTPDGPVCWRKVTEAPDLADVVWTWDKRAFDGDGGWDLLSKRKLYRPGARLHGSDQVSLLTKGVLSLPGEWTVTHAPPHPFLKTSPSEDPEPFEVSAAFGTNEAGRKVYRVNGQVVWELDENYFEGPEWLCPLLGIYVKPGGALEISDARDILTELFGSPNAEVKGLPAWFLVRAPQEAELPEGVAYYQEPNDTEPEAKDPTAGVKYDGGKNQMSLLPPVALMAVGEVLTFGAQKYAADNWRFVKGAKGRYLDALLRHIFAYLSGESHDQESGLHHLSHAACCLLFVLEFEMLGDEGVKKHYTGPDQ